MDYESLYCPNRRCRYYGINHNVKEAGDDILNHDESPYLVCCMLRLSRGTEEAELWKSIPRWSLAIPMPSQPG